MLFCDSLVHSFGAERRLSNPCPDLVPDQRTYSNQDANRCPHHGSTDGVSHNTGPNSITNRADELPDSH